MQNLQIRPKALIALLLAATITSGMIQSAHADLGNKPTVVSFTMSPESIDLASSSPKVTFDLVVNNPTGIQSSQALLTLSDGGVNNLVTSLIRTDSPVNNSLQTVKFEGSANISTLAPGVYTASAAPIAALNADGTTGLATSVLYATTTNSLVGAKNALLIRSNGELNFAYSTFVGPAFNKALANIYTNAKYNSVSAPIWKVGETFDPSNYYELTVASLELKVKTLTPLVCSTNGTKLTLIATGGCSYTVYTDKTNDYKYFKDDQTVNVTSARVKPTYVISSVQTQSSAILPLSIQGPYVMGPLGLVTPTSATPNVCYGLGFYISIISGGTCTLNYSTPGDATYLPSDVSTLTFQISRTAQTLAFTTPTVATLASKSLALSATASSGQAVTFLSSTPVICSVTGSSLNLLTAGTCHITASQNGTTTIAPASVDQNIVITGTLATPKTAAKTLQKVTKTLACIKNGKTKTVTSKTCPSGYKLKK